MKIAILNNLYYPFNRGGAESVIREMVNRLKKSGHEIFIITTKPRHEKDPENDDMRIYRLESAYFDLATMPLIKKLIWHLINIFSLKQTNKIKTILKKERPDLVMTHNLMGLGFRTPLMIKKLKIDQEHYLHDIQLLHPSGLLIFGQEKILDSLVLKAYQFFTRLFFVPVKKIFSPSKWLADLHLKKGFFKQGVVSVGPLIDKRNEEKNVYNKISREENCFLFVGQIETHKGIIFLLEAFKQALEIKPNLQLFIAGNGRLMEQAKQVAKNEQRINFLGHLDSQEVAAQMARSAYLIIPSLCYENSPMTIYEAHNQNLPIIAAAIGGIPEALWQSDILFSPGDKDDLIKKIVSLTV